MSVNSYATYEAIARAAEAQVDTLLESVTQVEAMAAAGGQDMPDLTLHIIQNQVIMWRGFAANIRAIGRDAL